MAPMTMASTTMTAPTVCQRVKREARLLDAADHLLARQIR